MFNFGECIYPLKIKKESHTYIYLVHSGEYWSTKSSFFVALPVTQSIDLNNILFPSSDLTQVESSEVFFSLLTGSL